MDIFSFAVAISGLLVTSVVFYVGLSNVFKLRDLNKQGYFDGVCTFGIFVGRNLVSVFMAMMFAAFCTKTVVMISADNAWVWHLVFFYIYLITMMTDVFLMKSHIDVIKSRLTNAPRVRATDKDNKEQLKRGSL